MQIKKFLKRLSNSRVWHYPDIEKSRRYPHDINKSMCGTLYSNAKQSVAWPLCKRCMALEEIVQPLAAKVKLPKTILEQSFEPPEVY